MIYSATKLFRQHFIRVFDDFVVVLIKVFVLQRTGIDNPVALTSTVATSYDLYQCQKNTVVRPSLFHFYFISICSKLHA